GLLYLQARYQDPQRGQFTSEDATFLAIGDPAKVKGVTGFDQKTLLSDPQLLNSYSYARNNPITTKDPKGNFLIALVPAIELGAEVWGAYSMGSSIGEVLNTNLLFRGDYSDAQRSDANFWFGVGMVTAGEGRIVKNLAPYEKVALNVGPDVARFIGD